MDQVFESRNWGSRESLCWSRDFGKEVCTGIVVVGVCRLHASADVGVSFFILSLIRGDWKSWVDHWKWMNQGTGEPVCRELFGVRSSSSAYPKRRRRHAYHYIQNWAWYELLECVAPLVPVLEWFGADCPPARSGAWSEAREAGVYHRVMVRSISSERLRLYLPCPWLEGFWRESSLLPQACNFSSNIVMSSVIARIYWELTLQNARGAAAGWCSFLAFEPWEIDIRGGSRALFTRRVAAM